MFYKLWYIRLTHQSVAHLEFFMKVPEKAFCELLFILFFLKTFCPKILVKHLFGDCRIIIELRPFWEGKEYVTEYWLYLLHTEQI